MGEKNIKSETYKRIFIKVITTHPDKTYPSRNDFLRELKSSLLDAQLNHGIRYEEDEKKAVDNIFAVTSDDEDSNMDVSDKDKYKVRSTVRHLLSQLITEGVIIESKTKNGIQFSINNAKELIQKQPLLASMSSLTYFAYPAKDESNSVNVVLSTAFSEPLCNLLNAEYNKKNLFFQPAGPCAFTCTRFLSHDEAQIGETIPPLREHLQKILGGIELHENPELENHVDKHTYENIYTGLHYYYKNGEWIREDYM